MSIVGIGTDFFRWLILACKVFLGAVLLMLLYVVFNFIFGFKYSEFARVALTSSAESDLVVTSFAQVDLLHLKNRRKEITIPSQATANNFERIIDDQFENAKSYCLHSYEVAFGYPSLSAERKKMGEASDENKAPLPEPQIVAVNVLRSENAPDSSTLWCQRKNLKQHRDDSLEDQLLYALQFDGVLNEHVTHGQMLLAVTLDLGNAQCRAKKDDEQQAETNQACLVNRLSAHLEKRAEATAEKMDEIESELQSELEAFEALTAQNDALTEEGADPSVSDALTQDIQSVALSIENMETDALSLRRAFEQDQRAANLGADVASIVLTFSTTLGISEERKRFLGLWTSKRFYLQRDIARVYYGGRISPSSVRTHWQWFAPNTVEIVLPRPTVIAMDRYSSFVVARNKIEGKARSKQSLANYLNQQVLMHLERGIKRFHNRAVEVAETVVVQRVPGYFGLENVEYDISFSGERAFEPNLEFFAGVLDLDPSNTEEPINP